MTALVSYLLLASQVILFQTSVALVPCREQPLLSSVNRAQDGTGGKPQKQKPETLSGKPAEVGADTIVRVNTKLITLPVSAVDSSGTFLTNLTKEDFRIYEDGIEQQVAFFTRTEQPVLIVIALDISQSTVFQTKRMKAAAISFLDQLRPNDYVYVVAFAQGVAPLHKQATNNREELVEAILSIKHGGFTSLYDAVQEICDKIFKGVPGRKAMILFSDGLDNLSRRATKRSTLENAKELDALIYTVQHSTVADSKYLKALAGNTGGRFFKGDNEERLKEAYTQVGEELRRQYTLGYYTNSATPNLLWRKIKVRATRPGVKIISPKTSIPVRR